MSLWTRWFGSTAERVALAVRERAAAGRFVATEIVVAEETVTFASDALRVELTVPDVGDLVGFIRGGGSSREFTLSFDLALRGADTDLDIETYRPGFDAHPENRVHLGRGVVCASGSDVESLARLPEAVRRSLGDALAAGAIAQVRFRDDDVELAFSQVEGAEGRARLIEALVSLVEVERARAEAHRTRGGAASDEDQATEGFEAFRRALGARPTRPDPDRPSAANHRAGVEFDGRAYRVELWQRGDGGFALELSTGAAGKLGAFELRRHRSGDDVRIDEDEDEDDDTPFFRREAQVFLGKAESLTSADPEGDAGRIAAVRRVDAKLFGLSEAGAAVALSGEIASVVFDADADLLARVARDRGWPARLTKSLARLADALPELPAPPDPSRGACLCPACGVLAYFELPVSACPRCRVTARALSVGASLLRRPIELQSPRARQLVERHLARQRDSWPQPWGSRLGADTVEVSDVACPADARFVLRIPVDGAFVDFFCGDGGGALAIDVPGAEGALTINWIPDESALEEPNGSEYDEDDEDGEDGEDGEERVVDGVPPSTGEFPVWVDSGCVIESATLGLELVRWLGLPEATRSALVELGRKAGGTVELSAEALRVTIQLSDEATTPELVLAVAADLVRLRPTLPLRMDRSIRGRVDRCVVCGRRHVAGARHPCAPRGSA